jgi:hypothetical protein
MSSKEVIKVMGRSDEKKLGFGKNILVYYLHSSIFDLFFSKNFPYIGPYPFNRTGKEYWVVLKDDKVVAFGYLSDFYQQLSSLK